MDENVRKARDLTDEVNRPPDQADGGEGDVVLRAKYRDYCSARVADVLLELSPEQIYAMAEEEAKASGRPSPTSYGDAVNLTTQRVRASLELPTYDVWIEAYRADPGRFEPFLLGLWESEED